MQRIRLDDWLQVAGFAGVIASLVFVGLELQHSRQVALGDAYQARADQVVQIQSIFFESDELPDVLYRAFNGLEDSLTELEIAILDRYQITWLTYYENAHYQYESGLLSEGHWHGSKESLRGDVENNPIFSRLWERERTEWRPGFAEMVDRLLVEAQRGESDVD